MVDISHVKPPIVAYHLERVPVEVGVRVQREHAGRLVEPL